MNVKFYGSVLNAKRDFIHLVGIMEGPEIRGVSKDASIWSVTLELPIQDLGEIQAWLAARDPLLRVADVDRNANSVRLDSGLPVTKYEVPVVIADFGILLIEVAQVADLNMAMEAAKARSSDAKNSRLVNGVLDVLSIG